MADYTAHTDYRHLFVGVDTPVPLLDNKLHNYINLDNAASTPALKAVQAAIDAFLPYYSSVHRGTGFKSQLSTHAYEASRKAVLNFLGADPDEHTCIFGKNTTEAINKLARRFPFTTGRDVVISTVMEHHSNDLPWRGVANVVYITMTPEGQLDETDFDALLSRYANRVALVAITGASNVTGYINPIRRLAEKAHAAGAQFLADCAQLAPHRKVDMRPLADPSHLDYVTISAHKMYAPFGTGALVGRRDTFEQGDPDMRGGGTVEIVTLDDVVWTEPPEKDEAGSPNTVGAIALAAAIHQLEVISMAQVANHEAELTAHALRRLANVRGIRLYGDTNPQWSGERLGVIPFEVQGVSHFKVAAILGYEYGIGVRSGCFCAHPYLLQLLGLNAKESHEVRNKMLAGDRSNMPGLTRASFGLYNSMDEVDKLVEALERVTRGEYRGTYQQNRATGEYIPVGWSPNFSQYLPFILSAMDTQP
jgi:cysteine desulfurase/selenocysteine lyase